MDGEATAAPGAPEWRGFLDRLLLWSGAAALSVAVVFFVAYNWQHLGRFAKFGAAELLVLGAVLAYWRLGVERTAAKAALLAAAILLGALLALFGQTYQTGADTWELFAYWAALMLPWAAVGRFAALWILWLALANVALALHSGVFSGRSGLFFMEQGRLWAGFALNAAALAVWELAARRFAWLNERWAPRLVAVTAGSAATLLALQAVFGSGGENSGAAALAYLLWTAALFAAYRRVALDVFMLAGGCLSLIVVVAAALGRALLDNSHGAEAFSFLLLALVVAAMAGASAWWLRRVAQEQGG